MDKELKELKELMKILDTILSIVIHNNNLAGYICEQVSPIPRKEDSFASDSPKEMVEEIFKNEAQYEIVGEA